MNFNRENLLLYAITDRAWTDKQTLMEQVEDALKGGATMVQLREKNLEKERFVKEAWKIKKVCAKYGVPFIINDEVDIALEVEADGVHVGVEDMSVSEIRKRAGENFIIGATAKTVEQAKNAQEQGADYLGVGAMFPSPTKKNAIRITTEQLREIVDSVEIPVVAIGGITLDNFIQIVDGGMDGIAVVSAIFGADDIVLATKELRKEMERSKRYENGINNCRK